MGRPRVNRVCSACDSTITYISPEGKQQWRYHDEYWYCKKCYTEYVYAPTVNRKEYFKRMFKFGSKYMFFNYNIRKHICQWCGRSGYTHMHHWFYLIIMPWACIVELCPSCHMQESWKLGQLRHHKR